VSNEPSSDFIWAYLFQYPGVLLLQDRSLHDSRVRVLERHRRLIDYKDEFSFNHGRSSFTTAQAFSRGSWPMLRAPLLASRLVVVHDEQRRVALEAEYPGIRFLKVPLCAAGPGGRAAGPRVDPRAGVLRVASLGTAGTAVVEQAIQRTRSRGVEITLTPPDPSQVIDGNADVVIALDSPSKEASLAPALAAMSHGKAIIVLEREATAAWPAFDPQSWRARDPFAKRKPIVVSIDPRDEEHSLMLALIGLAHDLPRRLALGEAARTWWLAHGTPEYAASVWRRVLQEAARTPPPDHPADWPAHLKADGAEEARTLAGEMGVVCPLFEPVQPESL